MTAIVPKVSVVLPTYNREGTLERAVRSVLDQGFRDLELLVIDDGSTDGTAGLLRRLQRQDPRLRPLRKANGGAAAARNAGLAMARGDFVAFQDSDDEWLPGHLEGQLRLLAADRRAVAAYSRMVRHRAGAPDVLVPDPAVLPAEALAGDLLATLLRQNVVGTPTALVRREAMVAAGPFDPSLRQLEDWDLWLRVARQGPFAFRPEATVRSTYQPDSLSLDRPGYFEALALVLRKHRAGYEADPMALAWHADRLGLHGVLAGDLAQGRSWSRRAWRLDRRRWQAGLRAWLPGVAARRLQRVPAAASAVAAAPAGPAVPGRHG